MSSYYPTGHNEIPHKLVKEISNWHIVKRLTYIYNQSLLTGVIPDDLKIALVTPVYKADGKEEYSNYRPISVLSCFSKILDHKNIYHKNLDTVHETMNCELRKIATWLSANTLSKY